MAVSVDEVFDRIVEESVDKRQQGTRWERAVQWFLTQDPAWRDRFEHVWMWDDAPTNPGRQDRIPLLRIRTKPKSDRCPHHRNTHRA